jgi:glycosyltransferase involved in cell wall biosynthesis
MQLSVVIPLRDEEENLPRLHPALTSALEASGRSYEIVYVDDGSVDKTRVLLKDFAQADHRVKVIGLRKSFGQTGALAAGFDHATGGVIITMDGDLQNDPADIPQLLAKMDEGYDVVSGWRKDRHDPFVTRRLPSMIANGMIGAVTGVRLHDYGCTLKAYRAEVIKGVRLYGEMHRFLPALSNLLGARIAEIPVTHHARRFGRSHYGLGRTLKVMLDLLTVKFLSDFATKPIYVFGGLGLTLCAGGTVAGAVTLWEKYAQGVWVHRNPLILLAVFLFLLGVGFIMMGLLAELVIRTYHESQRKAIYVIRDTENVTAAEV